MKWLPCTLIAKPCEAPPLEVVPELEPAPLEDALCAPELAPEPLLEEAESPPELEPPLDPVLGEVFVPFELELPLEGAAWLSEDELLIDDPLPPGLSEQAQSCSISAAVMDNMMRAVTFGSKPRLARMSESAGWRQQVIRGDTAHLAWCQNRHFPLRSDRSSVA
ncbi:hypothetical protein [Nevskia soli]|uniref:hypothetical protein n=1 Tax=Nevskia soli TaxID=418856 RepID=UPI0004A7625E|nr:hypothetical protein [Nevskia soli]